MNSGAFSLILAKKNSHAFNEKAESMKPIENLQRPKVLFISHKQQLCGVHEYGLNIAAAVRKSARYDFTYAECSDPDEFFAITAHMNPTAIIYNYYPSTMPWLKKKIMRHIKVPHIGIMHEVTQQAADKADNSFFQFHIAPDPTLLLKNPLMFKTGRLVPDYNNIFQPPTIPTIGSFGFGTKGKGFERLITVIQQEFDEAQIRLHIPYAAFGDATGSEARAIAERCRGLIVKPLIKLVIGHDFLNKKQLLDFLAQNTINAFFYEENKGRGISSVIDLALAVDRPIAISRSDMFRHLYAATPSICINDSTLRQIVQNGVEPLLPYRQEWCEENLIWDYERIIERILTDTMRSPRRKLTLPIIRSLFSVIRNRVRSSVTEQTESWTPQIHKDIHQPFAMQRKEYSLMPLPGKKQYNRILDDTARRQYEPIINKLFEIVPEMMAHKLRKANIQQAFVLDTVYTLASSASSLDSPKMLCVGSYDDTAAATLKKIGFKMDEVDPVLNYDLNAFFHKPTTAKGSYDVIFSTSVIEHVKKDELFITQVVDLLAPGGIAIITCDYNDQYKLGERIPPEDFRLYTQKDFRERLQPLLKDCALVDTPQWACPNPDFTYAGCQYTFATFVFKKDVTGKI